MSGGKRDWAWPWTPSWGPLTLSLRLDASAEVLERQVASLTPNPYTREREGRYRSRTDVERAELLLISPGRLQLVRSFNEPPPRVLTYDARLLAAMTVLGPLTWDLIDEDYLEPLGGGDDAGSLVRHLSPEHDEAVLRAEYERRFAPVSCDASSASSVDELFRTLSTSLGAPAPLAGDAFATWFKTTPGLPWRLTLTVDPRLGSAWHGVLLARPGLLLTIGTPARRG